VSRPTRRHHGAAEGVEPLELAPDLIFQGRTLPSMTRLPSKMSSCSRRSGLEGQDLLHAQRPLLIPGRGSPEASFQAGSCTGAGAGLLGERHGEHLDEDAVDVVLGLLLGEARASSPARRSGRCASSGP
jgi:hypothetical protein